MLDIEHTDDVHLPVRPQPIAFVGVAPGGIFRWVQLVADCWFYIDVRVEVECSKFTPDECLVLGDMRAAAQAEREYRDDPWHEGGFDGDPEPEAMWEEVRSDDIMDEDPYDDEPEDMDDDPDAYDGMDVDDSEGFLEEDEEYEYPTWHDESTVASGLYWLRVAKVRPAVPLELMMQARANRHTTHSGRESGRKRKLADYFAKLGLDLRNAPSIAY
ncbi:hypothetical protein BD413DRAFT_73915 [Trametes elegans]|nr:hypothetical protein BD413DRAFT_73915 [Trametes elegans]